MQLDESRRKAFDKMVNEKTKTKQTFDQGVVDREFNEGDPVLLWDKRRRNSVVIKSFRAYG